MILALNWDDPQEHFGLLERVGPDEYARLFARHLERSCLTVANRYRIKPTPTRYGLLFIVDDAIAFFTQAEAEAHALRHPLTREQTSE